MNSSKLVTASEIPGLSTLYKDSEFPTSTRSLFDASESINSKVTVWRGDITSLGLDAIVNAANKSLLGGGGVDGAIHRAAGPDLYRECSTLGGCRTGEAKITKGYELPAKHVIHTVGPIYERYTPMESKRLLISCYTKSLELAVQQGIKTVAFSGISTGVYGYPSNAAAKVACETVRAFLEGTDGDKLDLVVFVTFLDKDVMAYQESIPKSFPPVEGA